MVNIKQELENFPYINLKNLEDSNPGLPDDIKNSIILYNKALESLRTDSEDIAIIELKKAISINPGFYEAMNLLGLCYDYVNEKAKAAEMFEKVIAGENNGIKAMKYMGQMKDGDSAPTANAKGKRREINNKVEPRRLENEKKRSHQAASGIMSRNNLIKYLTGFAAGALLVLLLCLPSILGKGEPIVNAADNSGEVKELQDRLTQAAQDYAKLEEEYKSLQEDLEAANQNVDYYKFALKLYEVDRLAAGKKYLEAADTLVLLKTIDFKSPEKEKFDGLYNTVMPQAAKAAYDEGYRLLNLKKYEDSVKSLEKVQLYKHDFDRMDAVLYNLGKAYKELKDSRNAIAAFQKILSQYPESRYVQYARFRIDELTQQP